MDTHWGYENKRFEKIGYNIRKFYLQEKELQSYHKVNEKTIRSDYGHLKRYGKL